MRRAVIVPMLMLVSFGATAPAGGAQEDSTVPRETVVIQRSEADQLEVELIDELAPDTLLEVGVTGFDSDTTGTLQQCLPDDGAVCANRIAVRTDGKGRARFQYLVSDRFHPQATAGGRCRLEASPCAIVLRVGDDTAVVHTVFVDRAPPPGTVRLEPSTGIRAGDTVDVTLSGFPPGAELELTVCARPARESRCGPPAPTDSVVVGADGTAEASLRFETARVGADRVRCGPRTGCQVIVSSDQATVRANPVPVRIAATPGPRYDGWRVALGLAGAVVLLGAAAWLLFTTVWDPPRESDGSAIDEAELADLDREAAEFEDRTIRADSDPPQPAAVATDA